MIKLFFIKYYMIIGNKDLRYFIIYLKEYKNFLFF